MLDPELEEDLDPRDVGGRLQSTASGRHRLLHANGGMHSSPNAVVEQIRSKATPVITTTGKERAGRTHAVA